MHEPVVSLRASDLSSDKAVFKMKQNTEITVDFVHVLNWV